MQAGYWGVCFGCDGYFGGEYEEFEYQQEVWACLEWCVFSHPFLTLCVDCLVEISRLVFFVLYFLPSFRGESARP
jgi:hypothetical protein